MGCASLKKRRSWLYIPAIKTDWYQQLHQLHSDVYVFDLEDSIAPQQKKLARDCFAQHIASLPEQHTVFVRINNVATAEFSDDMQMLEQLEIPIRGIVVPKVSSADDIHLVENYQLSGPMEIVPIIETLAGEHNVESIINASKRIHYVQWGESADYSTDYGKFPQPFDAEQDALALDFACRVLKAGAHHHKHILDGLFLDYHDKAGLKHRCQWAQTMGFVGKVVIHPQQIEIVKQGFTPTQNDWDYANKIVSTYEAKIESGLVPFEGSFIHRPLYLNAKKFVLRYQHYFSDSVKST